MTLRITISVDEKQLNDKAVRVTPVTSLSKMEHGVPTILRTGQSQEFYLWDSQSLVIEEVNGEEKET